jgi:DNA repair protein RecO (recombination protein O)
MEFADDAFVLLARPHGETGAIVEFLSCEHGKYAAHVAGAASRRMKPALQAGSRVRISYRARTAEQLGSATLEAEGEGPAALFDDPLALAGIGSATAVAAGALPERQSHPGVFLALEAFIAALTAADVWPAVYVRFEAGLLADLGFGLDLARCAVTGSTDDLVFVSPRTGKAVSARAGEAYKDRLLALPPFLLSSQAGLGIGDVGRGLAITGHFLERCVFSPLNRPLPASRQWLVDRLGRAGRL